MEMDDRGEGGQKVGRRRGWEGKQMKVNTLGKSKSWSTRKKQQQITKEIYKANTELQH